MTQKRRTTKRPNNPEETRAMLLNATIELVAAKGLYAVSVLDVARRAKVSRGIAYHHYKDRDHLLREAMNLVAHRLEVGVKRLDGASLHDRVLYSTKFVFENPEICKLMMADALVGKTLDRGHPMVQLDIKMLRDLISRGQARAGLDAEIVTYIALGSIGAALMLREQHKDGDMDALAERFTNEWISILGSGIFADGVNIEALKRLSAPPPAARLKTIPRK